jgi:dihydropteroate synthase
MIVHIINLDNDTKTYLTKKYRFEIQFDTNEVVEVRNLVRNNFEKIYNYLKTISSNIYYCFDSSNNESDIIVSENLECLKKKLEQDNSLPEELYEVVEKLNSYTDKESPVFNISGKIFDFRKAYLMGILNVTPDSFSDGGKYLKLDAALNRASEMIELGVDIIDIGGESTRPGSDFVTEDEEKRRVLPVIENLLKQKSDLIISIDTTKSQVAKSALDLGAKIVNDVSAMTLDSEMLNVCSRYDATVVLMHMQGIPKTMQINPTYDEVVSDIYDYLHQRIIEANQRGINKIIIDPGIGFGKTVDDNFKIIKRLKEFHSLGYPILIGLSRKTFIGKTLNLEIDNRDFPSSILETISIMNSARIIRTHNVRNGRMLVDLINKML